MYVYQRRHVHVETRRRLTKFEVRTQVPPLIHWCVCGEKAMLIWYYGIYTQRLNNNNNVGIHSIMYYIHVGYVYK